MPKTLSHIIQELAPNFETKTPDPKGCLGCKGMPGRGGYIYLGCSTACRTNFSQWQLLGRDAAAAPRLNCNYGKLLYYVRNCVSIERAIFRAVKLVWRHKWLCCHYPLPAARSPCHLPLASIYLPFPLLASMSPQLFAIG